MSGGKTSEKSAKQAGRALNFRWNDTVDTGPPGRGRWNLFGRIWEQV